MGETLSEDELLAEMRKFGLLTDPVESIDEEVLEDLDDPAEIALSEEDETVIADELDVQMGADLGAIELATAAQSVSEDAELAALEAEIAALDATPDVAESVIEDGEMSHLIHEIGMVEAREAAYAEVEPDSIGVSFEREAPAIVKLTTKIREIKAREPKIKAEAKPRVPKLHGDETIGAYANRAFHGATLFNGAAADLTPLIDGMPVKVAEKALNLLEHAVGGKKLSVFTKDTLAFIKAKGTVNRADLIAHMLSMEYTQGTAASQVGQMFTVLPRMGVATLSEGSLRISEGMIYPINDDGTIHLTPVPEAAIAD